jgi:hypothetical protein
MTNTSKPNVGNRLTAAKRTAQRRMDANVQKYNLVKADPATSKTAGVFRPLPKGAERLKKWSASSQFGRNTFTFFGNELLDAFDLMTLYALIGIAYRQNNTVSHAPKTPGGAELRQNLIQTELFPDTEAVPLASVASFTRYELTTLLCGGDSAEKYQRVRESLDRLSGARIRILDAERDVEYVASMISGYIRHSDAYRLAINPLLSQAILADGQTHQYIKMALSDMLTLDGQLEKLLYNRLSAVVFEGQQRAFELDTLVEWLYPDQDDAALRRAQRQRIRKAVANLGTLDGWAITMKGTLVNVARKKARPDAD